MDETEGKGNPRSDVSSSVGQQIVGAYVDDAQGNCRLDDSGGGADDIERRQRQGNAVRKRKRSDDEEQLANSTAEKQQTHEKQQVIGADQDVVNAGRDELADDGGNPLAGSCKILERRPSTVENGLRERFAFIN